jgi:hypothetical protein
MARLLDSDPRRRNRLRLDGNPCFLFAHRFMVPLRAASPSALLDSTGQGRLGQMVEQSSPASHAPSPSDYLYLGRTGFVSGHDFSRADSR